MPCHSADVHRVFVSTGLGELDAIVPGLFSSRVTRTVSAASAGLASATVRATPTIPVGQRELGLELGADDYTCKPFSPREVVARVKAVLRRTRRGERPAEDGVKLDEARLRATIAGADLNLTAVEFQLLQVLADHPGRIYTREQLIDAMYRDERVVSDRTVDSHIKKIRRKISTVLPDREVVHSVYGLGYKYEW